jgi:hypothetical protein
MLLHHNKGRGPAGRGVSRKGNMSAIHATVAVADPCRHRGIGPVEPLRDLQTAATFTFHTEVRGEGLWARGEANLSPRASSPLPIVQFQNQMA